MNARICAFAAPLRSLRLSVRVGGRGFQCRTCRSGFSTSSVLRQVQNAAKKSAQDGVKTVRLTKGMPITPLQPGQRYPEQLTIYKSTEARSSWLKFWKANTFVLFGVATVFGVPFLWKNENQPNPVRRHLEAGALFVFGACPLLILAYLTAPFVQSITLRLPLYARQSRSHLQHFCTHLPPTARLEFTTLRAFPYPKHTAVEIGELRALPPSRWRFANIQRVRTVENVVSVQNMGFFRKLWWVAKEPRFKFYVREGRSYTVPTGVPGVWDEVAKAIMAQTVNVSKTQTKEVVKTKTLEAKVPVKKSTGNGDSAVAAGGQRARLNALKRQTTRVA